MKILNTKKAPTEMDRVMENIAQVEAELQQRILQLGQMYYEDNKNNRGIEEKYFAQVDLINKLSMNRKGFYKNKLRLEGQMMCDNCGAIIPYGSVFCNVCGGKMDEKQGNVMPIPAINPNEIRCKNCGAVLEDDSVFCTACGTKVNSSEGEGESNVL